jgi:hypothetical protein
VRFSLAVLLLFSVSANALDPATDRSLHLDLRMAVSKTQRDYLEQTAIYNRPWLPWLDSEFGVRTSQSAFRFENFEYKGEMIFRPVSFGSINLRVFHSNFISDGMGQTQIQARINLFAEPFSWIGFFGSFGWYHEWTTLTFPVFITLSTENMDQDFVAGVGFWNHLYENFSQRVEIATFDSMQTLRLNNPYLKWTLQYEWKNQINFFLYARYRILLGFGRLDEFLTGVGTQIPLSLF